MASGKTWANICTVCGRHVEILNGDFAFSMELHNQSHKSLDYVNNSLDGNLNRSIEKIDNASKLNLNYCHDCNESFEIINNNFSLSFQRHAEKHKGDNTDALSDHSSTSSKKTKGSQEVTKEKQQPQPVVTSMLDAIFHTMPEGLKAHRSFISEKGCSKAVCNLCEIIIDPIFSMSEHLKTKQHEDNTISVIKRIFSSELHEQMEFISFYGSNLCCNLCRCKIDLCSDNLHKTAMSIVIHNAGKGHSCQRTNDGNSTDKTLLIIKSLALMNPIINENQHFIEHSMHPYFKCKPCEKQLAYCENDKEMASNFIAHFNSSAHTKHLSAVLLLSKWSGLNIPGKENHNFAVKKQNIYCSSCNCNIEANLDQLLSHVRMNFVMQEPAQSNAAQKTMNTPHTQTDSSQSKINMKTQSEEIINKPSLAQQNQIPKVSATVKRLVMSLPAQFQNMVTMNKKGEAVCSICNCTIPPTTYNMTTHFNGNSHKKKENESKSSASRPNSNIAEKLKGLRGQEKVTTNPNSGIEFYSPSIYHSRLAENKKYFVRYNGEDKYICVLCGTIFQEDGNLQRNILLHIDNQDHLNKIQLKQEMCQLLPRHSDCLVKELFDVIPMTFQKDLQYIKAPEGMNFIYCEICYIRISRHKNCLIEHLEGGYHKSSVERFGKIQLKNVVGKPTIDPEAIFEDLKKNHKEIKKNSKYICKTNEDYFCQLCKAVIKASFDINLLEVNFLSHFNGKKHLKNVAGEFSMMLDKMQIDSEIVRNSRKFLEKRNDTVICTLCPCQISMSNADRLRHNLEVHLSGSAHKNKLESKASMPSASSHQNAAAFDQQLKKLEDVIGMLWKEGKF
ncbi:uncharacterized protein LOC128988037 isoform X3 [Macrosteles quadrilineatus]|uniref:uncharacterized protein LOC128987948 isoform X2 n=1 Tax=Macrosteles quadrilineatus TaxID=74068 RepID=UPI0023E2DB42|nr:uncharacterized protein LOC128987948 isoform X2 [Macrosteles quadrilineatus]XP_054265188.1 uncharacterized protein LOC128988037 isoform X3 [Macrosteles quadrilineatus]